MTNREKITNLKNNGAVWPRTPAEERMGTDVLTQAQFHEPVRM